MAQLLINDEECAFFEPFLALVRGQGDRPVTGLCRVLNGIFGLICGANLPDVGCDL